MPDPITASILEQPTAAGPSLRREMSAGQLFTLAFGAIIGVGWVIVLGVWLGQAGPVGATLGFVLGGLLMMLVGLCYAELATALPASGGEVVYSYRIFGIRTAFAIGWFLSLVYIGVVVFEAISVGWLLGTLIPGVEGVTLYEVAGAPVQVGSLTLGLIGTLVLTFLNFRGARSAAAFQGILTYALVAVSLLFILTGILGGRVENLRPFFQTTASGSIWPGVLAVLVTAPFWFAGFNVVPQVMEEKSEATSLSRAGRMILLSIGLAILFYSLVILSASMAVPWQQMVEAELPAAYAFEAAFNVPALARLVLVAALLGLMTTWNTVFISASRILFALGRARIIHPIFGTVHPVHGSPSVAVLFVGGIAFLGTFLGRSAILPIVNVAGICFAVAFAVSCLGVIRLRHTDPDLHRPYRIPGGLPTAWVASVAAILILGLALYQAYANAGGGLAIEWVVLAVWGGLGVLAWVLGAAARRAMNEHDRRRIILGASARREEGAG